MELKGINRHCLLLHRHLNLLSHWCHLGKRRQTVSDMREDQLGNLWLRVTTGLIKLSERSADFFDLVDAAGGNRNIHKVSGADGHTQ